MAYFLSIPYNSSIELWRFDPATCLNSSPDVKDWDFCFINAEFFFMYVYKNYMESLCTEAALVERSKKIVKKLIAGRPVNSDDEKRMVAELHILSKSTQQVFFEKHKGHFFMIDLIKENEHRFQVTFEQCKRFKGFRGRHT